MKCVRAQDLFSNYAESVMEPPLKVAFEQHLEECPQCRAEYERFNATLMMVEELPEVELPADFHATVMARIQQSQQVVPEKVRWWHLDLQRVFTVRVPAKAAALGAALLLLGITAVQLTPMHTVGAHIFGLQKNGSQAIGVDDPEAPRLNTAPGHGYYDMSNSGLSVNVDAYTSAGGSTYALKLAARDKESVGYSVFMVMPRGSGNTPYSSGYVADKQAASISVDAGVLRVEWQYQERKYDQYIFTPKNFAAVAVKKSLSLSDTSIAEVLRQVCESYGVVVIASGDLSQKIKYLDISSGTPDEALYELVKAIDFKWNAVAPSVYVVQPN